jgi:hypothetical protein
MQRLEVNGAVYIYIYMSLGGKGLSTQRGVNPLMSELNPPAQRCLTRFFTRDFVS